MKRDLELEVGSRAHYEDVNYYTSTYRRRIDDVQFYVSLACKNGGPLLEYGVGNGRIALPIARHGISVTGIDQSAPMLADLRARLASEPVEVRKRVTLRRGDMRKCRIAKRFPLVICPFNTALHLYTRADAEQFFSRVRSHLAPRGEFVVDISIPSLTDLTRSPGRAYHMPRFKHPTLGKVVRYREFFDYDQARQIMFVSAEHEPIDAPDEAFVMPLAHRQFFPQEWEALLHYNGFELDRIDGDFYGGKLTRESDVMVCHARKRRGWAAS